MATSVDTLTCPECESAILTTSDADRLECEECEYHDSLSLISGDLQTNQTIGLERNTGRVYIVTTS